MSRAIGKGKVAALVAGAAVVGAGVGLLCSPQTGEETRRQIRHYARKTQVEAGKVGRSMKAGVEKALEHGKAALPRREKASAQVAA